MNPSCLFASHAVIGKQYLTKNGWPVTVLGMNGSVEVRCDLTNTHHKLNQAQLLWPYKEERVSMEAIKMAKAQKAKSRTKKHAAPTPETIPQALAEGEILRRTYKGVEHEVKRLLNGFAYNGEVYKSLTSVAMKITGYKAISGPAFFKIAKA